jgi:ABC-type ATPase with predicted acetyltransferase domain
MILTSKVELDEVTAKISQAFDYNFTGESSFELPEFVKPEQFNIGLIVGNSGSGKTCILKSLFGPKLGYHCDPVWKRSKSIASHFKSFEEACEKLFAVGLSSIPTLCKPYHVLSNGEQYRANVARRLYDEAVIDEFTSVVNRETAYGICVAMNKHIKKNNLKNIVLASCHFDIVEWLQPDWVFDCNAHTFTANEYSLESFPKLGTIKIK